ncbi:serine hydrolase domain-containing protein [Altererythrobacter sp. Root672]|uniref:serine hydrolase domain-containing protein n=1 Tax=Altererythrobacter sp. Root672 TaxID=1736584 RepID=UPI0009E70BA2|nr:serine hydrolase [Altererythrobacter sp. Root672]
MTLSDQLHQVKRRHPGNALAAALLVAFLSSVPATAQDTAPQGGPSPATVAMRWQWLNPEINSFTFRETDKVFESRPVKREGPVWDLARGDAMTMPAIEFGGEVRNYERFAEDTFTNALLVMRDGRIVFEDYRNRSDAQTQFISFSMAKTITAMLVGVALEQAKIASLDDAVTRYLPELTGSGYDGTTIRQLLQMRSGVDYEERYDFGDNPSFAGKLHEQAIVLNRMRFADGARETSRAHTPGSRFNYSTLDTFVIGWVLERATGLSLASYTEQYLWAPLGAEADGFWLADGPPGVGRELSGMGFNAVLRDFARLGQLMLDGGQRNGRQILPAGWVDKMARMTPTGGPMPGYGLFTWQIDDEPGAFSAVGLAGQFIYVHPQSSTVIVKLSHYPPAEPPTLLPETRAFFKAVAHTR